MESSWAYAWWSRRVGARIVSMVDTTGSPESGVANMNYPDILRIQPPPHTFDYDAQWTALYALGVGAGAAGEDLHFVYEKRLRALPTMVVLMAGGAQYFVEHGGINYSMLVHGEQRLTIERPIAREGHVVSRTRCLGVVDKGASKGALVNIESVISDAASGERYATTTSTLFCRGDGGFGGPTTGELVPHAIPARPHERELTLPTLPQQAALYRLLGDRNPLHIDPEMARSVGFERPILHGLCTYGIACRAILAMYCDNDPSMIEQFDVRFSSPVYPGESITARTWRDGPIVSFECFVAERHAVVIRNGMCRLKR
jgi:acyl dehydratase